MKHCVCLSFFSSCPCRGGEWRRGCSLFQANVQRGFPIWPILWREPTCQHHHWKGPLWGGDAPAGFPDQAACGSDTPVTTGTLLCAQSTQFYQLRDQEQWRACPEELYLGCRGKNFSCNVMKFWLKKIWIDITSNCIYGSNAICREKCHQVPLKCLFWICIHLNV